MARCEASSTSSFAAGSRRRRREQAATASEAAPSARRVDRRSRHQDVSLGLSCGNIGAPHALPQPSAPRLRATPDRPRVRARAAAGTGATSRRATWPESVEGKLADLGIILPIPAAPIANYVGFVRTGNFLVDIRPAVPGRRGQAGGQGKARRRRVDRGRAARRPAPAPSTCSPRSRRRWAISTR